MNLEPPDSISAPVPFPEAASNFPVVGIGASAGGLEAFSHLLHALPADTGMAFVLVQHLDPVHESHLVDLLAKTCGMPVSEACHKQIVEPNHVYVIAPNTYLTIQSGTLQLSPRIEELAISPHIARDGGTFTPVDRFFSSLAEDCHGRAIGVILSGTGSDGTLGIKAIKSEGGITFAQDSSAPHEGMPRAAINSECVDFILPAAQIALELGRISQHPLVLNDAAPDVRAQDQASLDTLFQMLLHATRMDYAHYKRTTVMRRVQRRLILHRLDSLQAYLIFMESHPEELTALHKDLLIHVTRFFRDPQAFDALAAKVFPALMKDRSAEAPLRLWVAGCSTGEEVYSLAIRLFEFLGDRARKTPIKLFATDVSEHALEKARAGKYPASIAADVSAERLRQYFIQTETGYQIQKSIRDLCVFARHDMTRDPPFSGLDLISCRNVLIYLGPLLQKRVMPVFHYALSERGFLLLGGSESIGALTDLFAAVDSQQKIYSKKPTAGRVLLDFPGNNLPPGLMPVPLDRAGGAISGMEIQREADRVVLAQYAPVGVVVSEDLEILQSRGQTSPYLSLSPGVASLNLLKMARDGLLLVLRSALEEAKQTNAPTLRTGIRVRSAGESPAFDLRVLPITIGKQRCFAVLFEEPTASATTVVEQPARAEPEYERQVAQLQQELTGTKEYLQTSIEQLEGSNEELKAANEEIISSNEELQITNEELQTAKEELQATNEELNTVNDELQHRNREATQLSDDLSNLFRSAHIPIVIVGQDLRIRRFTPSAVELFHFIASDVGRPIADITPRLVDADPPARIVRVLETLATHEVELRDLEGRWHRVVIRPYLAQENRVEGAVVSVIDIDSLKQSELAIKQSRDYAESIISTIEVPLLVLDSDLRVVSANASFQQDFRMPGGEVENHLLIELFDRQWEIPELIELLRDALQQNNAFRDFEVSLEIPAIGPRILLLNARRLQRPEQLPAMLLFRIVDITESRRLENQLRQVQKMEAIGHLAAGVAHDFNNLLTVVNGYCSMLEERFAGDPETKGMLARIGEAGSLAADLTRQLLAFSRKSILAPKVLNLNVLMSETVILLDRLLGDNIHLKVDVAPGLGQIRADRSQLEQAILSLAINARDAMPQGGDLTILVRDIDLEEAEIRERVEIPAGPYVKLVVRDTGVGMDARALAHVFEPFFTAKEVGKGTGLGLASVYGSVTQSGGFIDATSQPGFGSEFMIWLPRLPAIAKAGEKSANSGLIHQGRETVLMVDDSCDVRTLACFILRKAGYVVLEARDGPHALKVAEEHAGPIHLMATDVVMPRMGGRQLAERMRGLRPDLRVLYLSGFTESFSHDKAGVPAKDFLAKPYSPSALAQKIRELLDAPLEGAAST